MSSQNAKQSTEHLLSQISTLGPFDSKGVTKVGNGPVRVEIAVVEAGIGEGTRQGQWKSACIVTRCFPHKLQFPLNTSDISRYIPFIF
jgi:hypothetical protein